MKRIILFILCSLLLFCTGCSELEEQKQTNEENAPVSTTEEPVYLELHFGNGEALRKEISHLDVPIVDGNGRFCYAHCNLFGKYGTLFTPTMNERFVNPYVTLCTVVFKDGQMYSLHDVRNTEVNEETRTLIAYLWRDEPRETEREYFEAVEKEEEVAK